MGKKKLSVAGSKKNHKPGKGYREWVWLSRNRYVAK